MERSFLPGNRGMVDGTEENPDETYASIFIC
jgi:hypothetical protein